MANEKHDPWALLEARALAGEKLTDEDVRATVQADINAKMQRFVKHLQDLEDPNVEPEPCGGMFCSCNSTFRRMAKGER
jgi:hypothetical protein